MEVGDLLEAKIENGKITSTPKSQVDAHLAEALDHFRNRRTYGPYESAEEAIRAFEARVDS